MIQRARQPHQLGPADHGRRLTYDEFMAGDYEEGYKYEFIDGELYVSPQPNLPQDALEKWLLFKFGFYAAEHQEVINYLTNKPRIFVPGHAELTVPEPDLAAYNDFPQQVPDEELDWRTISPFLVAEVLSPADPNKDLVRNVNLYWQVPSIKEYWVFDTRLSAALPVLVVHRRQARRWKVSEVAPGGTYTTKLLPSFELIVDRSK